MTRSATAIDSYLLEDGDVAVSLLNLGAITQGWWVPCRGEHVPVVLGYREAARYETDQAYLGAIVGRVANRVAGGQMVVGGQAYQLSQNEGSNHLHGGWKGLHRRLWVMEPDCANRSVRFSYTSADGEEGYPGEARFAVTISLKAHTLTYAMHATVDRPTPISLAQHNYYNLSGQGPIWDHRLTCLADRMTPTGPGNIPTGEVIAVDGSAVDFRKGATFGNNDPEHNGTDINLVLPETRASQDPAAEVVSPKGLRLRLWTDQPGVQLYTGVALDGGEGAHGEQTLTPFAGFCLEPQGFPNAVNTPSFPSVMVTPEQPYRQTTKVEISEVPA